MKLSELVQILGIRENIVEDHYVNPLALLISDDFRRHSQIAGDYRDRAINRALAAKVNFNSEINSLVNLAERLITMTCPVCKCKIKSGNSGGGSKERHIEYRCRCGVNISLELQHDAISVGFPKKEK